MLEPQPTRQSVQTEGKGLQPLRRRLAAWVAAGVAPPGLAPAAVAAAHARLTGRPPARDPDRSGAYRVYSADELRAALIELGCRSPRPAPPPPPPLDPLPVIWQAAAQRLALPSARMLLLHQARLIALRERGRLVVAVIAVAPQWRPLIEARRALVARALADTLGRPVALELQGVGR